MSRFARQLRDFARFAPGRPSLSAGVRAAVATVVPLLVGQALNEPAVLWTSLMGFSMALADKGGAYRLRAATMGALALSSTIAVFISALVGGYPVVAVITAGLWCFLAGLARAYGTAGMPVAISSAVVFVVSLAYPAAGLSDAITRAIFLLIGAAWAMLLSLVLWPVRMYRPGRRDVAECYRALADYAASVADLARRRKPASVRNSSAARAAVEKARTTLASIRRGRPGESPTGERLLMLLENGEAALGELVALADLARLEGGRGPMPLVGEAVQRYAGTARSLADAVEREKGKASVTLPEPVTGATTAARALLVRLRSHAESAAETVEHLNSGRPAPVPRVHGLRRPRPFLEPLRGVFCRDSLVLRHALRVGLATAAAVAVAKGLGLAHGYWVTITVLVVLQPYTGATVVKGMQRIAGTVLGAILAALIAAVLPNPTALITLVFVLAAVSVSLLPINYWLYAVFLTPTFVLLIEVSENDWTLAQVRVENTLIGGGIALVGAMLLWASPERERLPSHLAATLLATRRYVGAALGCVVEGCGPAGLATLRRKVGLELINTEASLQRWLTEESAKRGTTERAMAAMGYLRRLASAATLLSALPAPPPPHRAALGDFAREIDALLAAAGDGLDHTGVSLPPTPSAPPLPDPELDRQLVRIARLSHGLAATTVQLGRRL